MGGYGSRERGSFKPTESDGECIGRARADRRRQDGGQGSVRRSRKRSDHARARRLRAGAARALGRARRWARLRPDLRRRCAWPQSQSRSSARGRRSRVPCSRGRYRSLALCLAARPADRARRPALSHLREQRRGRARRPRETGGGRRHRGRLDQLPSPRLRARRRAALHRERGGCVDLRDRRAGAQGRAPDRDAASARGHCRLARRRAGGRGRRSGAAAVPDRCGERRDFQDRAARRGARARPDRPLQPRRQDPAGHEPAQRHSHADRCRIHAADHARSRQAAHGWGVPRRPALRRLPGRRQYPCHRSCQPEGVARLCGWSRLRDRGVFLMGKTCPDFGPF